MAGIGVRIGCGTTGFTFDCLAFADDTVLLSDDLQTAVKQIEILQDVAAKTGLRTSFEKAKYMDSENTDLTRKIETAYRIIQTDEKCKYLGEILTPNGNEKEALGDRARKMEMAFKLCHDTYKSRSISFQAKLKHYCRVVRPEGFYAAETLVTVEVFAIEKKERKFLRKILGFNKVSEEFTFYLRSNKESYQRIKNISITLRKRRLAFYGHIKRMNGHKILTLQEKWKTEPRWLKEVHTDLHEGAIRAAEIQD